MVVPVENDPLLDAFAGDFRLTRVNEAGLSVVVPYVDQTITPESVVEAIVRGYFYPILRGELVVEVAADGWGQPLLIDASTLSNVVSSRPALEVEMRPLLELSQWSLKNQDMSAFASPETGSPKWDVELISSETRQELQSAMRKGERMRFRASLNVRPKSGKEQKSHFDAFFLRDPLCDEGQIVFVREGIIVSNVRPRRSAGIRGLVIIDDEPLATFLGDAENPSHTDWQKDVVKDKYVYAPATLNFVIDCIPAVIRIIGDEDEKAKRPLWNDLFALSVDDPNAPKGTKKKPKLTPGDTVLPVPEIPAGKPKRYRVDKTGGGFVVRRGDPEALMPSIIEITAAYGVRKGSPFKRYRSEDFAFGKDPIKVVMAGAQELDV